VREALSHGAKKSPGPSGRSLTRRPAYVGIDRTNAHKEGEVYFMSVIMTLYAMGDAKRIEKFASENREKMQAVLEAAKRHGLIAHRFYGSDDGSRFMVADEWPDRQSFESFFQEQQPEIGPMMAAAGVTSQPDPIFWSELETGDAFGWDAGS
jgi:hypothetical protein